MRGSMKNHLIAAATVIMGLFFLEQTHALIIEFNYQFDTNDFFAEQARRDILDSAAAMVAGHLVDNLAEIPASTSGAEWQADFFNPRNGIPDTLTLGTVPQDTLIVFVAGGIFGANTSTTQLAQSFVGDVTLGGANTQAFDTLVQTRGQTGAGDTPATDFGPWGGSIGFNQDTPWNFSLSDPAPSEFDLLSIAIHELGHILGIGTSDAWNTWVDTGNREFTGTAAMEVFGEPVPLDSTLQHLSDSGISPEPAMDPLLTQGTRKLFTDLDHALLQDIGWQVPEPTSAALLLLSGLMVATYRGRRASQHTLP